MKDVPVIVEFRIHQARLSVRREVNFDCFAAFRHSALFGAIPGRAATTQLQMSLDSAKDRLFFVSGTIEEDRLEELRSQPNVIAVFVDNELVPFDGHYGTSHCDDWLIDVGLASPTDCPIPSFDCEPTHARGCLRDVATYVGADLVWRDGINGDGIVIGMVDGGLWAEGRMDPDLPGLVPRVIGGWSKENWGTIAGWRRHGNMMAIASLGIAPKASFYDIRIANASEQSGRMSAAIAGVHWAIERYRASGTPQILCCGWGIYRYAQDPTYATDFRHPLTRKIIEAIDEGILVIFAAGNGGQCCPATWCGSDAGPSKGIWGANGHPRVMTVAAANRDEQLIGYSSQGPAALDEFKPDFCGISHFAGYFSSDSGTSAACAIAAGIAALLKQARPTLTQEAAKRILQTTAKDIGPPGWDRHSGAGIIQAKSAYDKLVRTHAVGRPDSAKLSRLETENRCLREMFIELALEQRMRTDQT